MKVEFGLSNLYYFDVTESNGVYTFGVPKQIQGAKSMKLSFDAKETKEYADNILWYYLSKVTSASADVSVEVLPDEFKTKYMSYRKSDTGSLQYDLSKIPGNFGMMFQTDTDVDPIKYIIWNNHINGESDQEHNTNEDELSLFNPSFSTTASALNTSDGKILFGYYDKTDSNYATLFTKAPTLPTFTNESKTTG